MTDRRRFFANSRVAHISLEGQVEKVGFVKEQPRSVITPIADLLAKPDGAMDRQILCGDVFEILEDVDGWCFGRTLMDGYVGYVKSDSLGPVSTPTHRVCTMGAHAYPKANIKTKPAAALPFGAMIHKSGQSGDFVKTELGYIFERQLEPIDVVHSDYMELAERMIGVPYLWGGNSQWGLDCSGLVQMVLRQADYACPSDSDMQEAELGTPLEVTARLKRGDIVFWKGHVGLMQSATQIIHANGFHMAVTSENLIAVLKRIEAAGGGRMTSSKRLID